MNEATQVAMSMQGIDLAQQADFDLGLLRVRPASCAVEWKGAPQILQRRVMQVLVALAQARGCVVSQSDLVNRCWGGLSVSEDAIYRCISKLRKLAADYPGRPYAIEVIAGVGYRLTSPAGDERVPATSTDSPRRLRAWLVAAALVVMVMGAAAFWIFNGRAPGQHPLRAAVQPFEVLGDTEDARSLARRIPNEVVDALGDSQIETVLTGEQAGKQSWGSRGGAPGLVVTGIVRDDGRNIIVDVRLEDGASRAALWSTEFSRGNRLSSDLPLEVAARVADVANMINFARTANPPLTDDSALTALLHTTDMIRDADGGAWAPMVENAEAVVARHPEFAFGHSVLAEAYAEAALNINVPERARAMAAAARQQANLALKLDPEDAGAQAALSDLVAHSDYRAREAVLLQGIKFGRHPREPLGALYSYEGTLLSNVGRLREALSLQLIAQAMDKWGAPKALKVARIYADIGNLAAADAWIEKAFKRWPSHSAMGPYRLYVAGFYERPADAFATIDAVDAQSPDQSQTGVWRTFVEARAAHSPRSADLAVRKIREAASRGEIPVETEVMMLAALGKTKEALEASNLALDHQPFQPRFLFTPVMRDVRRDPAFVSLASRLGLIKYWRETGKLPDFCTDAAAGSEFSPELRAQLKPH